MSVKLSAYRGNIKGLIFYLSYRLAHFTCKNSFLHIVLCPLWILYRLIFNWILGIDISETTKIGKDLIIWHGMGIVVHPASRIGNNVILRHCTTLGNVRHEMIAPVIEDRVDIGCGAIILGDIVVGHDSIIGAGSVVTKNIPPFSVVVGNPAKIIKNLRDGEN